MAIADELILYAQVFGQIGALFVVCGVIAQVWEAIREHAARRRRISRRRQHRQIRKEAQREAGVQCKTA